MNINPRTKEAYQLFHQGILALSRAEQAGLRVDVTYIEKKKAFLTKKIEHLEDRFKQTNFFRHWQHSIKGKVNINSNAQLSAFLYTVKKIEIEKETDSGQGATDYEALRQMNIPELNDLLEIRKLKKVRDVYLDGFLREQVDGYTHPSFNLHLPVTYRSSSDHPNFQNIPARDEESMQICRRAIFPRPGHQFLEVDFKSIEVAVGACYHKDSNMLKYLNDPKSDMHADVAKQVFLIDSLDRSVPEHEVLRQAAKNGFVFPEFYGDYYKNCATNVACKWGKLGKNRWKAGEGIKMPTDTLSDHLINKGIKSLSNFEDHLKKIEKDFWKNRFSEYADWKDRWCRIYRKYGYIDLLTGFRCSGIMNEKELVSYPIQGAAFHCLLFSFIQLDEAMTVEKWDTRLVGQVHDNSILDVNPSELEYIAKTIKQITTKQLPHKWPWIIVPMEVKMEVCPIDGSWAEKTKYKI